MKNLTKLLLITIGAGLYFLPAIRAEEPAPDGAPAPERREQFRKHAKERGEKMAKELNLTADQQAQMKTLMQAQQAEAKAVRADTSLSKEQKHEKMEAIQQTYKDKRHALLTPEQQKKADEMRARHEERREKHRDKVGMKE